MAKLMNRMKLQLPIIGIKPVHRPHLEQRLNEVLIQPQSLALLVAPAGFGKTTLAASWAKSAPAAAWLSLDVDDNEVMSFLLYLIEAVRTVEKNLGQEALEMIQSAQPPSHLVVLKTLLYELEKLHHPLCVVLDDYQVLSANPVREVVNYLLEYMPPALRLVILSRSDPALALPRLRKEGRLVEIGAEDLRFSLAELEIFLNESMDMELSRDEIAQLNARIEGWPAGLQMAALALKDNPDIHGYLSSFSGSKHYILDYLGDTVFVGMEKPLQSFLLKTSILNCINASLASNMLETRPILGYEEIAASDDQSCQAILENLYRLNLFVTPLDENHVWFQYHQLFSDLLKTRLHILDHAAFKDLHLQASNWYEKTGKMAEAVSHALMAEEEQEAGRLFEQHAVELLQQGDLAALKRWVGMLSEEVIRRRPWLCIAQAWVMTFAGRLTGLDGLLDQAETLAEKNTSDEEQREITAHTAVIRSFLATMTGNLPAAIRFSKNAARQFGQSEHWVTAMLHWVNGTVARMQGKLEESDRAFASVLKTGQAINNLWTIVTAATEQGLVRYVQGDLKQARHILTEALNQARQGRVQNFGCVNRLDSALANILYDQGQLEEAMRLVEDAIEGNRFWKNPNHLVYALLTRARIQLGSEDLDGARDTLEAADQETRGLPLMGVVSALLDAVRVQFWLKSHDLAPAAAWAAKNIRLTESREKRRGKKVQAYQEDIERNQITLVRVFLAQKQIEDAFVLLDQLQKAALAGGRGRVIVELMVLRAKALNTAGQTHQAVEWLDKALKMATPQGVVRLFTDEGSEIEKLLSMVAELNLESSAYARQLMPIFSSPKPVMKVRSIKKPSLEKRPTAQPLSQREKEILNLIAAGLTNHQIATQLVISTGTVKAHSANIYRKLSAGNRIQAVERARALKLLT
jgi:LuxR family transcriptional regulator, maltose regulon positive regulatory protein